MDIMVLFNDLFLDYTLRMVAVGTGALGIVSGALGAFAVLRKQSLLGDAISHAALPGVVLAFLLTRSKAPIVLVLGAAIAGLLATLLMMSIVKNTRIKEDGALALVLSVFFGLGLMLLTFTQRLPDARQAGLDHFLFGQAAALLARDVITIAILGGIALIIVGLFWKEFKLLSFDPEFGASLGFPMGFLDVLMTILLVVAIVIGLQTVGVVLMSAMIVAPAAAARQWTDRLGLMILLSAFFGALAGVTGAVLSSLGQGLSTGPMIVLSVSVIVIISIFLAPNRGLLWKWARQQRNRRKLRLETVLSTMYLLAAQHGDLQHAHSVEAIRAVGTGTGNILRTLQTLEDRGWVKANRESIWSLTEQGVNVAEMVLRERGDESSAIVGIEPKDSHSLRTGGV